MTKARSNAVAEATKGDLSVGTGTNLAGILAVGTNGDTLVADSSTTTGLRYNPQNDLVNPVINGGMDIWQRGTSFTAASVYTADRWQKDGQTTRTISRENTGDTTNLPNIQYCLKAARNNGDTVTFASGVYSTFENATSTPFIGKTVTWSFYARKGSSFTGSFVLRSMTGTGTNEVANFATNMTGQVNTDTTITLTTTWQRFAVTVTIPTSATQIAVGFRHAPTGTASDTNDYFEVTGVQLDFGTYTASTAPAFRRSGGTIQGELGACQRYFYRHVSGNNKAIMTAAAYSSTVIAGTVFFKTEMRTTPTLTVPNVATYFSFNANSTFKYASTLSLQEASPNAGTVFGTFEATTAGFAGYVITSNASSFVDFGAEL
jgi:hypothetical protein